MQASIIAPPRAEQLPAMRLQLRKPFSDGIVIQKLPGI
jgi:hypothetical protein